MVGEETTQEREGEQFGRDLADRMAVRMRLQRVTAEQVTFNVATQVAKRAKEMLDAGIVGDDVAAWVAQVQIGFVERLGEETCAAPVLHRSAVQASHNHSESGAAL